MNASLFDFFGNRLKAYRQRSGLTQRQLAAELGVHRNTIGAWERGEYLPETKGMVLELARHLHLNEQEARSLLQAGLTALSPYWFVPYQRNVFFTGRDSLLQQLHENLRTHACLLCGMGGIGKTQLALEYAYRFFSEYTALFWLQAESEESLRASLLSVAELLDVGENQAQEAILDAVFNWLQVHPGWLLILDNVEDRTTVERFFSPDYHGTLLLTTRYQQLALPATRVQVEELTAEESFDFLRQRLGLKEPLPVSLHADIQALVRLMDGLPLALDQAAGYISEAHCSLRSYLYLLRTRLIPLLQDRSEGSSYPYSLVSTFELAFEKLQQRDPLAADFLLCCCWLVPDTIPVRLFREGTAYGRTSLRRFVDDASRIESVLETLEAYSLIRRNGSTFSIHRLVQAIVRTRSSAEWLACAVRLLEELFPRALSKQASWSWCDTLVPHVFQLTAQPNLPEKTVFASLLLKCAHYLARRVRFEQAEALVQRALQIQQGGVTAISYTALAVLRWQRGRYTEAAQMVQQGLAAFQEENTVPAEELGVFAALLDGLGHMREAEAFYRRALAASPAESPALLNNFALHYYRRGRYDDAERLYRRAIRLYGRARQETDLVAPLNNLALVRIQQKAYSKAEMLLKHALHLRERLFGPDHPAISRVLKNLARCYQGQGRYTEAEEALLRALRVYERHYGPEHPELSRPLSGLAQLYVQQERYSEAEAFYERAQVVRQRALGSQDPALAELLIQQGQALVQQGRYSEAETLYERAQAIQQHALRPEHPDVMRLSVCFAYLYRLQGRQQEATALYERAQRIASRLELTSVDIYQLQEPGELFLQE
uniref:Tetratricopeptide repeat protein n=1 Tax=Thermosporothrix sp. COM3 TaxID=2490863 RepID=A0A455SIZ2_9CHLR|nr:tetratricopeptide repeat protein [Thermosporothrix sp. COM3]